MKPWLQRMLEEYEGDEVELPWMLLGALGGRSYDEPETTLASLAAIDELADYRFDTWADADGELEQEEALERWRQAVRDGPDAIYNTLFTGPALILEEMPDWWHDLTPLEDDEEESGDTPPT